MFRLTYISFLLFALAVIVPNAAQCESIYNDFELFLITKAKDGVTSSEQKITQRISRKIVSAIKKTDKKLKSLLAQNAWERKLERSLGTEKFEKATFPVAVLLKEIGVSAGISSVGSNKQFNNSKRNPCFTPVKNNKPAGFNFTIVYCYHYDRFYYHQRETFDDSAYTIRLVPALSPIPCQKRYFNSNTLLTSFYFIKNSAIDIFENNSSYFLYLICRSGYLREADSSYPAVVRNNYTKLQFISCNCSFKSSGGLS